MVETSSKELIFLTEKNHTFLKNHLVFNTTIFINPNGNKIIKTHLIKSTGKLMNQIKRKFNYWKMKKNKKNEFGKPSFMVVEFDDSVFESEEAMFDTP